MDNTGTDFSAVGLPGWRKIAITNAQVAALGAAVTGDITLFDLTAKEFLENIIADVTVAGGGTTSLTMGIGKTSTAYVDCIVASDIKTAAIVLGVLAAQRGVAMIGGDYHVGAAATYKAHFISTVQNLSAVTNFACTVYYKVGILPT